MRNLFDQYSQQENRLTHALAVCLDADRKLLRDFLRWIDVHPPVRVDALEIVEQGVPGDVPESEDEAERRGLPDIVIHDDDNWCLIVESKVAARLTADQLRRHQRTLARRGFERTHRLALIKNGAVRLPPGVTGRTWSELYAWLGAARRRREWPDRLRSYLRAAEVRLAREEYLTEGTLTVFDGFPFSTKNPYTYGEGKRLLRLALEELKSDRRLRALGMDPKASGRPAITGKAATGVWDFLSLKNRPRGSAFTAYPHLTLAVHQDHLEVAITIPNSVARPVRRRFAELGTDGMVDLNEMILRRSARLIKRGAVVFAIAHQRHYPAQRSAAVSDAELKFRLETTYPRRRNGVKPQPEWVEAFAKVARHKRSNVQFQYRLSYPWGMRGLDTRESLRMIVDGWVALEPVLDRILGPKRSRRRGR